MGDNVQIKIDRRFIDVATSLLWICFWIFTSD